MKISGSRFAGASIAVLSLTLAAPAIAQDNATPTTEAIPGDQAAQGETGNGIVVYGLRRADTLQDTPAAITAFSA
jgi:iron complex outermembrane receptor protein